MYSLRKVIIIIHSINYNYLYYNYKLLKYFLKMKTIKLILLIFSGILILILTIDGFIFWKVELQLYFIKLILFLCLVI